MGKVMPNIDEQSTKLLSLTVLQRIDPFVEDILITAAHVTFYRFNTLLSPLPMGSFHSLSLFIPLFIFIFLISQLSLSL